MTERGQSDTRRANPDDPPTPGPGGLRPEPYFPGLEGRIAIVQGQVFLLAVILIAQIWLITTALYELFSGRPERLGWLTLASGLGFALALLIFFWPRRQTRDG
ncbi:MAG TPA: hypothetical protein VGF67_29590 [Ktedonobacteraceae bacterium]|jgi:hypothetical protein